MDDELPVGEVEQYYLAIFRKALPGIKWTAFALIAYGIVGVIQVIVYALQKESFKIFDNQVYIFLWLLSNILAFLVGYKLWRKYQDLQDIDKQGLEESQIVWMKNTKHIWQLLALMELIDLIQWWLA